MDAGRAERAWPGWRGVPGDLLRAAHLLFASSVHALCTSIGSHRSPQHGYGSGMWCGRAAGVYRAAGRAAPTPLGGNTQRHPVAPQLRSSAACVGFAPAYRHGPTHACARLLATAADPISPFLLLSQYPPVCVCACCAACRPSGCMCFGPAPRRRCAGAAGAPGNLDTRFSLSPRCHRALARTASHTTNLLDRLSARGELAAGQQPAQPTGIPWHVVGECFIPCRRLLLAEANTSPCRPWNAPRSRTHPQSLVGVALLLGTGAPRPRRATAWRLFGT